MVQSPDSRCVSKPQPEPSRADLRVEWELTVRMVLFRIADGPHEPLLERHTVVRGLCTRRRFLPTFTTATCEPFRAARSSVSVVTHATGAIAIAAAAAARSAPRAVGVCWPPVVAYSSLSITTTTRFPGRRNPIVASDPRFINSDP